MKVLGFIDTKGFTDDKVLVEIGKDELNELGGRDYDKNIEVGDIIHVSRIYENARQTIEYYKNFKSLLKEFEEKAKFLEKILNTNNLKEMGEV